ncbi:hypothetical protein [Oricola sp.]|uniref:hypothetical protein n=1 Tax=Oricola sp. TaxID=1979950 RepID=UPI003BAC4AB2
MMQGTGRVRQNRRLRLLCAIGLAVVVVTAGPAHTQIGGDPIAPPPTDIVPLPEPFNRTMSQDPDNPLAVPGGGGDAFDSADPVVGGGIEELPEAVRRTRAMIMEAAQRADFEALRPLIGSGEEMTQLSLGGYEGDPVAFLRSLSGDQEGHEILAILIEVLEAGYAIYDPGTPNETFVWPYFVATPLEDLSPTQRVDLFKLVTSGDFEDMRAFGAYIFYRAGISPDGRWRFFVAGD